jgi:hypothetical protein
MLNASGCKWLQTVANGMQKEMQIRPCPEGETAAYIIYARFLNLAEKVI